MAFDEYSKLCSEKIVHSTKFPVWGYIIFIRTNRKLKFRSEYTRGNGKFRGCFVDHETFFVFFVSSKILWGPGFMRLFYDLWGSTFLKGINFRCFVKVSWMSASVVSFLILRFLRKSFVDFGLCGFLFG